MDEETEVQAVDQSEALPLPVPRPKRRRATAAATDGTPDGGDSASDVGGTPVDDTSEAPPEAKQGGLQSTVDDDRVASGQTNVDSPQETDPQPEQPRLIRYLVTRAHDGRGIGQEVELEPTGEVMGQVSHGLLVQLER